MADIIIIGAGIAGLTSAIYALRANLKVLVIDKNYYGGQMVLTSEIENYPGIPRINGVDLAMSIYNQAVELGAEVLFEEIEDISLEGKIKFVTLSGKKYEAKAVILANGADRRKLGCPGEEKFSGRGVSYCATCDGALYKNKTVSIVGGGNTALEDALFLSNNCEKVYLIHRRDTFRGDRILIKSILARKNIEILYNSQILEIFGDRAVTSIKVLEGDTPLELELSAVFVAIGLEPKNTLFPGVPLDEYGYILAGEDCLTGVEGVYVAGDTRQKPLRQLVTAASDGAVAAFQAGIYINSLEDAPSIPQ